MIRRLLVEHFRSIGHLDLQLRNTSIFVGPNATGKSNIVDAIRLLKDAMVHGLDRAVSDRQGIDTIRQWSPTRPYHISLGLEIETRRGFGKYRITIGSKKGNYIILAEAGEWTRRRPRLQGANPIGDAADYVTETAAFERSKDGRIAWRLIGNGTIISESSFQFEFADELLLRFPIPQLPSDERISTFVFPRAGFDYLRREISDFEAYSIFPNTLRSPQNPTNDELLHNDGSNFISVFRALSRNRVGQQSRGEIIDSVKSLLPNLHDISIHLVGGFLTPIFRVEENNSNPHDFNVSQISDGTLRMLGLLTALHHPNRPQTLALEEPEQTVNPGVLLVLAEAIKSISGGRSQVIITTHSPSLIDFFNTEDIFAVRFSSAGTKVEQISGAQREAVRQGLFSIGELILVEGLGSNSTFDLDTLPSPSKVGDPRKLSRPGELEKHLRYSELKDGVAVLLVQDCDDGCAVTLARSYCDRAVAMSPAMTKPFYVAMIVKEFEALLLSCVDVLARAYEDYGWRVPADAAEHNWEEVRDAKGALKNFFRSGRGYKELLDQPRLAASTDVECLRRRSRSFRHLERVLLEIARQPSAS